MNSSPLIKQPVGSPPTELPAIIERLLQWSTPAELFIPIAGDCEEEYCARRQINPASAGLWLAVQTFKIVMRFAFHTQRGTCMFLFALVLLAAAVVMVFVLSGELSMFFNMPSFLLVVPPAIAFARVSATGEVFKGAINALFNSQSTFDQKTSAQYRGVFSAMAKSAMILGWFGVVTGCIAIASNVEPEVFSQVIGPATAVCLLTLLYALIVKAFCFLAELKIQSQVVDY